MEMSYLRMSLCTLVYTFIVIATVTARSTTLPLKCNSFRNITAVVQQCVEQFDSHERQSGLILTSSQMQDQVEARCSVLASIRTCVNKEFASCPNIDVIMKELVDGWGICDGSQADQWVTQLLSDLQVYEVKHSCSMTMDSCASPEGEQRELIRNIWDLQFKEGIAFMKRYYTSVFECARERFRLWGPGPVSICRISWSDATIMIDIQLRWPLDVFNAHVSYI